MPGKKIYNVEHEKNEAGNVISQNGYETKRFKRSRKIDFKVTGDIIKKNLLSKYPQYREYIEAISFNETSYNNAYLLDVASGMFMPENYGFEKFDENFLVAYGDIVLGDFSKALPMETTKGKEFFDKLWKDNVLGEFMVSAISVAKEDDKLFKYVNGTLNAANEAGANIVNEDYDINSLINVTKSVANMLGSPELFAEIEDVTLAQGSDLTEGLMISAPGNMASSKAVIDQLRPTVNGEVVNKAREFNGESIRKLSDIAVFDYLTGNNSGLSGDGYNFELTDDNQIKSITKTDISHEGLFANEVNDNTLQAALNTIGIISTDMANKIKALKEEEYKKGLRAANALTEQQVEAAWKTVSFLQNAIAEGEAHYANVPEGVIDTDKENAGKVFIRVTDAFDQYNLKTLKEKSDESIYASLYTGSLFETGETYNEAARLVDTKFEKKPEFFISEKFLEVLGNERKDSDGKVIADSEFFKAIKDGIKSVQGSSEDKFLTNINNLESACDRYIEERDSIFRSKAGKARVNLVKDLKEHIQDLKFEYEKRDEIEALTYMLLVERGFHPVMIADDKLEGTAFADARRNAINLMKKLEDDPDAVKNVIDNFNKNFDDIYDRENGFMWEGYKNSDNPKKYAEKIVEFNNVLRKGFQKSSSINELTDVERIKNLCSASDAIILGYSLANTPVKDSNGEVHYENLSVEQKKSSDIMTAGGMGSKATRADSVYRNAIAYTAYVKNISLEEATKLANSTGAENTVGKDYYVFMQENPIENLPNQVEPLSQDIIEKSAANQAKMYQDWYSKIADTKIEGFDNIKNVKNNKQFELLSLNIINANQNEQDVRKVNGYYKAFNPNYEEDLKKYGNEVIDKKCKDYYEEKVRTTLLSQGLTLVYKGLNDRNAAMRAGWKAIHEILVEKSGGVDGKKISDLDPQLFGVAKLTCAYSMFFEKFKNEPEELLNNFLTDQMSESQKAHFKQMANETWKAVDLATKDMIKEEYSFKYYNVDAIKNEMGSVEVKAASKDDTDLKTKVSFEELEDEEGIKIERNSHTASAEANEMAKSNVPDNSKKQL